MSKVERYTIRQSHKHGCWVLLEDEVPLDEYRSEAAARRRCRQLNQAYERRL